MIDFTSEEGIMDAIDKFFNLSQEEKDNYNKSLKVDKANILRFLNFETLGLMLKTQQMSYLRLVALSQPCVKLHYVLAKK